MNCLKQDDAQGQKQKTCKLPKKEAVELAALSAHRKEECLDSCPRVGGCYT